MRKFLQTLPPTPAGPKKLKDMKSYELRRKAADLGLSSGGRDHTLTGWCYSNLSLNKQIKELSGGANLSLNSTWITGIKAHLAKQATPASPAAPAPAPPASPAPASASAPASPTLAPIAPAPASSTSGASNANVQEHLITMASFHTAVWGKGQAIDVELTSDDLCALADLVECPFFWVSRRTILSLFARSIGVVEAFSLLLLFARSIGVVEIFLLLFARSIVHVSHATFLFLLFD
jgi:hypothetical protein